MATVVRLEPVGRIATVTIDRPQQLNAIDRSVVRQLDDALARIETDEALGAFVDKRSSRSS